MLDRSHVEGTDDVPKSGSDCASAWHEHSRHVEEGVSIPCSPSPWAVSRCLPLLLVATAVSAGTRVELVLDATWERRGHDRERGLSCGVLAPTPQVRERAGHTAHNGGDGGAAEDPPGPSMAS